MEALIRDRNFKNILTKMPSTRKGIVLVLGSIPADLVCKTEKNFQKQEYYQQYANLAEFMDCK